MKKKLITIVLGVMLCMSILGGCGQKETKQNNTATSNSGDQNKETTEEKELVGTIDEIKDFMFIITHHIVLLSTKNRRDWKISVTAIL